MARAFSQRPSDFLHLSNPTLCYDFDLAVFSFGSTVESRVDQKKKPHERERELRRLLGLKPPSQPIDIHELKQLGQKVSDA
jgi:hypothetical protein